LTCKWLNLDEIMKSWKGAVAKASSRLALRAFASEHGGGRRSGRRSKHGEAGAGDESAQSRDGA
jgi:hypothetical protein